MAYRKWAVAALAVLLCLGLFGLVARAENRDARPAAAGEKIGKKARAGTATLTVEGARQGKIATAVSVLDFQYGIVSPRDPASGLPTGKRMHKPLTVTKEIGPSTPQLFRALVTNEVLPEVTLTVQSGRGDTYTITLTNAILVEVVQEADLEWAGEELRSRYANLEVSYEMLTFVYERIEIEFAANGQRTTATDDLQEP